jgi:hypothetical protein
MKNLITYLALHGVLVLIVSLISGRWFSKAITSKGNEVAWRVVHSGGSMGGIMLIAFSSLLPILVLPKWGIEVFIWSIILGTWAFVIAMIIAAVTGERGLVWGGSVLNRGVYTGYLMGAFLSLLGCGFLLAGLIRALD